MVNLRLTREECQVLLTWVNLAQTQAQELGIPFEPDELNLRDKIRTAWKKSEVKPNA